MRSRALTETLSRPELTLLVEEFRCQTHSIANQMGAKASHRLWRIGALGHGRDALLEKCQIEPVSVDSAVKIQVEETQGAELPEQICSNVDLQSTKSPASEPPTPTTAVSSNEGTAAIAAVKNGCHVPATSSTDTCGFERDLRSVTMEVTTDVGLGGAKAAALGTQVTINADGNQLYPKKPMTRNRLHDDWSHDWKYRTGYPGVGLVRPGEAWIPGTIPTDVPSQIGDAANLLQTYMLGDGKLNTMHHVLLNGEKFPAVLKKQLPNGCFDVTVFKENVHITQGVAKFSIVEFPAMHRSSIFVTETGANIELPDSLVSLEVARMHPQSASVKIAGDSFLQHLGRVSPKPSTGSLQRVVMDCPKQLVQIRAQQMLQQTVVEKPVEMNVNSSVFIHFQSGEVRRGHTDATRLSRTWTVQLGPFATHTVRLVKKNPVSAVMTLYVDDEVLVECLSTDLEGSKDVWTCKFAFVGERQMTFRVHDETKDGWPLDTRSEITKSVQYRHVVQVSYAHRAIDNLVDATMKIDSLPFASFPCIMQPWQCDNTMSITPNALRMQFGIEIPKKVATLDARPIVHQLGYRAVQQAGGWDAIGDSAAKSIADFGSKVSEFGSVAWGMIHTRFNLAACQPNMEQFTKQEERYDLVEVYDPRTATEENLIATL